MQTAHKKKQSAIGFTLLEMLLVLTISSSLILLLLNYTTQKTDDLRRDKTVLEIQQIQSSALSWYVNNSQWPVDCSINTSLTWATIKNLTNSFKPGSGYLPPNFGVSPYVSDYQIACQYPATGTTAGVGFGGNFYVSIQANNVASAQVIAGRLPMSYITTATGTTPTLAQPANCATASPNSSCTTVISSVAIPGQNLNNARSVNFTGLYYSGSCVPAPNCPPGMSPSIMVAPASVAGVYDNFTCANSGAGGVWDPVTNNCTGNLYPITSFAAFARGDANGNPVSPGSGSTTHTGAGTGGPLDCSVTTSPTPTRACWQTHTVASQFTAFPASDTTKYWRVCLYINTQKGPVNVNGGNITQWGKMSGNIIVMTRCVPNQGAENPQGSVDVFQSNVNYNE